MPHDGHDHHDHDGLSPSGHPYRANQDVALSRWQVMEIAIRELMIERGVATAEAVAAEVDRMARRSPALGARVVARAWTDPAFRALLLRDGSAACAAAGIDVGPMRLIAVENTARLHNVVVCTLCSCYPRNLLGLPPDWYKSRAYRSRTVREPRAVLREFGTEIPDGVEVRVHDSTADMRYLVVPRRPDGTDGWDAERLAILVTRDAMIGVREVAAPAAA